MTYILAISTLSVECIAQVVAAMSAPGNQKELYLGIRAGALTLPERLGVDTQVTALKLAAQCFLFSWKKSFP